MDAATEAIPDDTPETKAARHGRGTAKPHYIMAYNLAPEFLPRDETGCYLTYDCPELLDSAEKSQLWDLCLKALYKHSANSLYKGQEVKTLAEFSKAIHARLLQMNRQIRNHKMPGELRVPFTKRNAAALANYKNGELYASWQQQKLPSFITALARDAVADGSPILPNRVPQPSQSEATPSGGESLSDGYEPEAQQAAPNGLAELPKSAIPTREVKALLNWGLSWQNSTDQQAGGAQPLQSQANNEGTARELETLRTRVANLENELEMTKEELEIQQSKLRLEMQHTRLLKRKYEGPCPD